MKNVHTHFSHKNWRNILKKANIRTWIVFLTLRLIIDRLTWILNPTTQYWLYYTFSLLYMDPREKTLFAVVLFSLFWIRIYWFAHYNWTLRLCLTQFVYCREWCCSWIIMRHLRYSMLAMGGGAEQVGLLEIEVGIDVWTGHVLTRYILILNTV